jgi:hypothetical protein
MTVEPCILVAQEEKGLFNGNSYFISGYYLLKLQNEGVLKLQLPTKAYSSGALKLIKAPTLVGITPSMDI